MNDLNLNESFQELSAEELVELEGGTSVASLLGTVSSLTGTLANVFASLESRTGPITIDQLSSGMRSVQNILSGVQDGGLGSILSLLRRE